MGAHDMAPKRGRRTGRRASLCDGRDRSDSSIAPDDPLAIREKMVRRRSRGARRRRGFEPSAFKSDFAEPRRVRYRLRRSGELLWG